MFRIFVQSKLIENFKELNCFRVFSDVFSDSHLNRSIFERELDVGIDFSQDFLFPGTNQFCSSHQIIDGYYIYG